jgi:hypothetical protein
MTSWCEEYARVPALTSAEAAAVDHYLAVLEFLGKTNLARAEDTYRTLLAAQALAAHAARLRDALALMWERGETSVHAGTLGRALRVLDAEKWIARIALPQPSRPEG